MKTILSILGISLLSFVLSASLLFAADPRLIEQAKQGMLVCAKHMPNSKAARAALLDTGYRYEMGSGKYHFYSFNGRRVLVATTVTHSKDQGCLVSVSKMTPAEAEQLASIWVKATKAKRIDFQDREISAVWIGTFKGKESAVIVTKKENFQIMRGASISLFQLD